MYTKNRRRHWRYTLLRAKVYRFLERPRDTTNFMYQVGMFDTSSTNYPNSSPAVMIFVALTVILAAIEHDDNRSSSLGIFILFCESTLALFFLLEYSARLWCVGACARYQGLRGELVNKRIEFIQAVLQMALQRLQTTHLAFVGRIALMCRLEDF